jgi:hypothetical protein
VPKVEGGRELVLALEGEGLEDELGHGEALVEVILLQWRGREGVLYDCVESGGLDGVEVAIAPTDKQMDRKLSLVVWRGKAWERLPLLEVIKYELKVAIGQQR